MFIYHVIHKNTGTILCLNVRGFAAYRYCRLFNEWFGADYCVIGNAN